MKTCTVADVMSWGPCQPSHNQPGYPVERSQDLFAHRKSMSAMDILSLDIPPADRLWVVLREHFFSNEELSELACRFAERVLPNWTAMHPDDDRPQRVIEARRKFNRGEITKEEWSAAWSAAWSAESAAWSVVGGEAHVQIVRAFLEGR